MAGPLGKILLIFSTFMLFHAAYSAYEHFSILKALGQSEESIRQVPGDIIVQTAISVVLFLLGVTIYSEPLKEITWASEMQKRSIDEMNSRLSFATFTHRGPDIFSAPERS